MSQSDFSHSGDAGPRCSVYIPVYLIIYIHRLEECQKTYSYFVDAFMMIDRCQH